MAVKPTIALARFADLGGADVVAPSSGLRDTGFVAGTAIVQSYVSYLFNQLYQWSLYLSDGSLTGTHTLDGNLTVGGQAITFTSHTFTASSSTDELTVTGHGLSTGDGPLQVSNSGGGLPAPLAAATNYYAIVTGANTFKVALTRTNALSGFPINLTSNGTGTNSVVGVSPTRTRVETVVGDLDATRLLPLVNASWATPGIEWTDITGTGTKEPAGTGGADWGFTSSGRLMRRLDLPAGAVVSTIRIAYDRIATGGNAVGFALGSRSLSSGGGNELNFTSDTTTSGFTTADFTNLGVDSAGSFDGSAGTLVIQPARAYWLAVNITRVGGTMRFYGDVINP